MMNDIFEERAMHYQNKKKPSPRELRRKLGKAFNFTQGDLAANRAGFVSFRQQGLLREKLQWLLGGVFGAVFFAAGGLGILWVFFDFIAAGHPFTWYFVFSVFVLGLLTGFMALCSFGLAFVFGMGAKESLKDIRNHQDDRLVNKILVSKNPKTRALESDEGRIFPISEDAYRALRRKGLYCLYYADGIDGPIIYSIESLSELLEDEEAEDSAVNLDEYKVKNDVQEEN
jgi:hypothetical protein